jgi:hypothetical protein
LVWSNLGVPRSAARYRNPLPGLDVNGVVNAQLSFTMTIVEAGGIYEVSRWSHGRAPSPRPTRCWAFVTGTIR